MDPWGETAFNKYEDVSAGSLPERWATRVVPVSPTAKLSQERKGHGSSLALAALELAEKEKELMESLPRSGEGLAATIGSRLLKMASVDRDFDAGITKGERSPGTDGAVTSGEECDTSTLERIHVEIESVNEAGRLAGLTASGDGSYCCPGSSGTHVDCTAHTNDDSNHVDDTNSEKHVENRESAGGEPEGPMEPVGPRGSSNLSLSVEPPTSVSSMSSKSPTYKIRQIQGFVQDRKMSTSPLASNDVDVAVRCGFGSCGMSQLEANGATAEVVFHRHFAGHPTMIFVGVMEGHGPDAREMAVDMARFLPETLEKEMTGLGLQRCSEDVIKLALEHACEAGHARLLHGGYAQGSGVTAMFGLVAHDKAYMANVGKGRCVLVSERMLGQSVEFERVSNDLDGMPSTPSELERILKCGGAVGRFEDEQGIPYGSLRIFKEGSRTHPGLTSSRALGNAEGVACGVLPVPVVTECTLNSRNAFFIWGSEGVWDVIGDEDASRVVSQYARRRVPGLTSADVLSFYAQSQSRKKKVDAQEPVNVAAVVVVDLREHIVPAEMQGMSEEDVLGLRAPRSNEEAYARACDAIHLDREAAMDTMEAIFARVESLCELDKTKEIEFCDRTSSLTQMMRGESGDLGSNGAAPVTNAHPLAGGERLAGMDGADKVTRTGHSLPVRHGGLPLMPSSSFDRLYSEGAVRPPADHETGRGLSSVFVPSQAIGVPSTGGGRKAKAPSGGLKDRRSISDELRPIRKVGIPTVQSLMHIKSSDSMYDGGPFSQQSQSLGMHEVWSLSERALSPQSSDGMGRAHSLLLEHGMRHEGKVRRGIPASFKSTGYLRLSSDSESEPRSWSRANSLEEEITLGFEAPNSPLRPINRVPSGSFGSARGSSLLASSSYRNLRRQRSASVSNLKSLAEDEDGKPLQRKPSNSVHVVKDIHKFFN